MRCSENEFREMGRGATGVKGITLEPENDEVIGMLVSNSENDDILVVSETGFGKRSQLNEYRKTKRGGKGVMTMKLTDKTGGIISFINVNDNEDLMIINRSGITIRMKVSELRVLGRNTQGVKLINLRGKDYIASITKVPTDNEEPSAESVDNTENQNSAETSNTPEA
jgi:DNA gyrase subunit A